MQKRRLVAPNLAAQVKPVRVFADVSQRVRFGPTRQSVLQEHIPLVCARKLSRVERSHLRHPRQRYNRQPNPQRNQKPPSSARTLRGRRRPSSRPPQQPIQRHRNAHKQRNVQRFYVPRYHQRRIPRHHAPDGNPQAHQRKAAEQPTRTPSTPRSRRTAVGRAAPRPADGDDKRRYHKRKRRRQQRERGDIKRQRLNKLPARVKLPQVNVCPIPHCRERVHKGLCRENADRLHPNSDIPRYYLIAYQPRRHRQPRRQRHRRRAPHAPRRRRAPLHQQRQAYRRGNRYADIVRLRCQRAENRRQRQRRPLALAQIIIGAYKRERGQQNEQKVRHSPRRPPREPGGAGKHQTRPHD